MSRATLPSDDSGLVLPRDASGKRSSIALGRAVFADALRAVSPRAAQAIESESDWHRRYPLHIAQLVAESARTGAAALAIAEAGLASLAGRLRYVEAGSEASLDAIGKRAAPSWRVAKLAGRGEARPAPLEIPFRGQALRGDTLARQLDDWSTRGIIEPSHAQMLRWVDANPDACDLSDQRIALLGARAEMGPLTSLARWRAQIVAVDLPKPAIWRDIVARLVSGNATLLAPLRAGQGDDADTIVAHAGADLLCDLADLVAWLADSDRALTIGAYAYLDGALHVRVAAAMDTIQAAVLARRPDTTLAMLATPTDCYAVPAPALDEARRRYAARSVFARLAGAASGGRLFAPHQQQEIASGTLRFGIADNLVVQQGPNYALAKRLQQWRAVAARSRGTRVSIHVAPPATTYSVLKNRLLASAYRGARHFGIEAFAPATASALMAALLVYDLRHPAALANPAVALAHPLQLIAAGANHGGLWRMPYLPRSALPAAALLGFAGS